MSGKIKRILVTGAGGQIGNELTWALRERYGDDNVVMTDVAGVVERAPELFAAGPFLTLDVTSRAEVERAVATHRVDTIVHLAALLSVTAESNADRAWEVNVGGTLNVLNTARDHGLTQVFIPSSIAVFGAGAPKEHTPNDTVLRPSTIYGISKVAGELLGNYYVSRWGVDVRGVRYPGIIGAGKMPSGGTTDYAVEMFFAAVRDRRYTCYVREDTRLPMMYMPDCVRATLMLMAAPPENLLHHTDFNLSGLDFTAGELADAIRRHIPEFECAFEPDDRQFIADSWVSALDDSAARREWGWAPSFTLESMVTHMLGRLGEPKTPRSASIAPFGPTGIQSTSTPPPSW